MTKQSHSYLKLTYLTIICCLLLLTNYCFGNTGASFLKIGVGARAIGMGGAFSAIADDVNAIHWNPAGLTAVSELASEGESKGKTRGYFSAMHTDWITDISYDFIGFVLPLRAISDKRTSDSTPHPSPLPPGERIEERGVIGGSLICLSQGSIEGRDENRQLTRDFDASDMAMTLSYAQQFGVRSSKFGVGINLKLIRQQIESEEALGFAFDFGLLMPLFTSSLNHLFTAFTIQNLGPQMKFISEGYNLPLSITAGAGYVVDGLTVALDIKQQVYEGKTDLCIGTEYLLMDSLSLRAGYLLKIVNSERVNSERESGLGMPEGLGAGFGLEIFGVNTDYSFTPYGNLGNTHRISVSAKF